MYLLSPIDVVDSVLTASSLAETDHSAWSSVTPCAAGDRVIVTTTTLAKLSGQAWTTGDALYWNSARSKVTTTRIANGFVGYAAASATSGASTGSVAVHAVYEATDGSTNVNPVSNVMLAADDASRVWVKVGATNKWKAFDDTMSDPATSASDITYGLTLASPATGIALFGLNAASVTVEVEDGSAAVVFTETRDLIDTSGIVDWLEFYTWDPDASLETEVLMTGLPGYVGYTVNVTVAGTNVEVGEIVLGKVHRLGTALAGSEVGFEDFSGKDRDEWGTAFILEREYADTAVFRFAVPVEDMRRVKRLVADHRAVPAVWFAGSDIIARGATLYGFPTAGLRVVLEADGFNIVSLETEGLT